jgi:hypothetical protein
MHTVYLTFALSIYAGSRMMLSKHLRGKILKGGPQVSSN